MSQEKYIGIDVHQATISVAVLDAQGKLIMECLPLCPLHVHRCSGTECARVHVQAQDGVYGA